MKVLMLYTEKFAYTPALKVLGDADADPLPAEIRNALIAFIQVEEKDEGDLRGREKKLVNTLKWAARKNETKRIVLHSFAHLSDSKAEASYSKAILDEAEKRLQNGGYETRQTPYGYFLDLEIKAPGHPLARLFSDL
ncbi:MAG: threonyl-tRNA synthetase editing domain-containing protein [Bacteroidetes bacterium]|nr:threonyl-tRNA synthetase editing domain-containing protein [Bacteroidota bacterium]